MEAAGGKRQRDAEASKRSRARKRRELELLRSANAEMRGERERLRAKITQLEAQVENRISADEVDAIAENSALRLEIGLHKTFIDSFMKLVEAPSDLVGQRALCREGAEAAQAYVHGLVAESQTAWQRLLIPPDKFTFAVEEMVIHYKVGPPKPFGSTPESGRISFRLDLTLPGVKAEAFAQYYWQLYSDSDEQHRCFGVKALELAQIDMPDEDTKLMYNRKSWCAPHHTPADKSYSDKDQAVVFICNRQRTIMPLSTLRPPHATASKGGGAGGAEGGSSGIFLGNAPVISVAMTSTRSTHAALQAYGAGSVPVGDDVRNITSVISQGALCWDDEDGAGRLVVVLSYPEEFRWLDLTFADVADAEGRVGDSFARLLVSITERLRDVFYGPESKPASPSASAQASAS